MPEAQPKEPKTGVHTKSCPVCSAAVHGGPTAGAAGDQTRSARTRHGMRPAEPKKLVARGPGRDLFLIPFMWKVGTRGAGALETESRPAVPRGWAEEKQGPRTPRRTVEVQTPAAMQRRVRHSVAETVNFVVGIFPSI